MQLNDAEYSKQVFELRHLRLFKNKDLLDINVMISFSVFELHRIQNRIKRNIRMRLYVIMMPHVKLIVRL